jgi:hypothetical protein
MVEPLPLPVARQQSGRRLEPQGNVVIHGAGQVLLNNLMVADVLYFSSEYAIIPYETSLSFFQIRNFIELCSPAIGQEGHDVLWDWIVMDVL